MGRRKQAVAQGWNAKNKQRSEEVKKNVEAFKEKNKKEISKEEHQKRIEMLKKLGLIKE